MGVGDDQGRVSGAAHDTSVIRGYRDGDLGRVVDLWQRAGLFPDGPGPFGIDAATDLLSDENAEILVADDGRELVGVAAGGLVGATGTIWWVVGDEQTCGGLIDRLEGRLAERGARLLTAVVGRDGDLNGRLAAHGYERRDGLAVMSREIPPTRAGPTAVSELGGQDIDAGLWDALEGMEQAKHIIERRVILPLEQPDLASRHGVSTPRAVVLFGPPGTGKTTFAKGVAGRLGWPFVEIEAAQLTGGSDDGGTGLLAATFDRLLDLPSAVAFIDEVEDVAASREDERKVGQAIVTELLRQMPRLRGAPHHLLVCATNWVGRLDPAFLRPGRFDYVLPVGPPDAEARQAIWRRYVTETTDEEVDLEALVEASEHLTPADIEFAARKAAQAAFEREHFADATTTRATTEDFLTAVADARPTLTADMIAAYERDVEDFARY